MFTCLSPARAQSCAIALRSTASERSTSCFDPFYVDKKIGFSRQATLLRIFTCFSPPGNTSVREGHGTRSHNSLFPQPNPTHFAKAQMPRYDEGHFRGRVDRALTTLKQALHTTRHPTYAEDTDHTYDDKFGLIEFLTWRRSLRALSRSASTRPSWRSCRRGRTRASSARFA